MTADTKGILLDSEAYVLKKEVNWSLFTDGFAIPIDYQVIFRRISDRFLQRGESKEITLILENKSYHAKLNNNNIDKKFGTHSDIVQVRYTPQSDFANAMRSCFFRSYTYFKALRDARDPSDRSILKLPEDAKEYIAVYSTEYDDTYIVEPIFSEDIQTLTTIVKEKNERIFEAEFNYDVKDESADMKRAERIVRIRKLNRKIGENLKLLYGYRCQICGRLIGEEYGSHIAEAHHIDYFVNSLNNDASNQLIVCPNHHSIIHDANPVFDRKALTYKYENGLEERLLLNLHL